jgi:hypothetical protein
VRREQFDLARPFPGKTLAATLDVHLFFVKLFGCKIFEDAIPIDLAPFSTSLLNRTHHPDVNLVLCDVSARRIDAVLMKDSDVHLMHERKTRELHGATWMYLANPFAIKCGWVKPGALLSLPGHVWHPSTPTRKVKLSPFEGGTEPIAGPRALVD